MGRGYATIFGLVLTSALTLPANAGDQAPFVWTGAFAGINGGYGWSASDSSLYAYADNNVTTDTSPVASFSKSGGFGGGQIGYNLQRGAFVFGFETDFEGSGIDGRANASAAVTGVTANASRDNGLGWFGTARGRLGYASGRTLVYFTTGFAYGGGQGSSSITIDEPGLTHTYSVSSSNTVHTGYVLGGGLEYAFAGSWSLKAEYQYIDLTGVNGWVETSNNNGLARNNYSIDHTYNTVRLGLNYNLQSVSEPLK